MLKHLWRRMGEMLTGRKLDDELLEELEETLIQSDVSLDTTGYLLQELREAAKRSPHQDGRELLQDLISSLLGDQPVPLCSNAPGLTVWLLAGVNGSGKTTTAAKLAHRLQQQGHAPLLVAADTFRAAAVEQLQEWGRRTQVPVVAQQTGADPAAVVFDGLTAAHSRGHDFVLVDTAGRLHTRSNLMQELAKISRVVERATGSPPQECLLVVDASTGQNGLAQAKAFAGSAPLTGLVLTKLDGTARGGIVLTVTHETGLPVKLVGVGEKMTDLEDFNPQKFAGGLLE